MFLLDDILKAPAQGLLWVVQELHEAARRDRENEAGQIRNALRDLYLKFERGEITAEQFDGQESVLLDRLDELEGEAPSNDADEPLTNDDSNDELEAARQSELAREDDELETAESEADLADAESPGDGEGSGREGVSGLVVDCSARSAILAIARASAERRVGVQSPEPESLKRQDGWQDEALDHG